MRSAAILAIGDELTLGQNLDTNSAWLADQLAHLAIITREQRTVDDDRQRIAQAIDDLADQHDLLIMTGGLGPTDDDLTRDALADALTPGRPLVLDPDSLQHLEDRFAQWGRPMAPSNRRQAQRPETMKVIANPNGTAPGLVGTHRSCEIYALPGPPREMNAMFLADVKPRLAPEDGAGEMLHTAAIHEFGLGESDAALRLGDLLDRQRTPLVGITASAGIVSARIRAHGLPAHAAEQLEQTAAAIEQAWVPYAFGRDKVSLAHAIGLCLKARRKRLVTAESCTGGWLGKMIVDVAGSSDYYLGGWVTYANEFKARKLSVSETLLEGPDAPGAVSADVATVLARSALSQSNADYALSITGVAGPDGTERKPPGLVFIGLAHRDRTDAMAVEVRQFLFPGERNLVRDRAAKAALQMLRLHVLGHGTATPLIWESSGKANQDGQHPERAET